MTELAKHYDHRAAQARCRALWDSTRAWHAEPPAAGEPAGRVFSIVIPPPNVTGALHLGHALNNTLQDILVRARRMQGYRTLWMPGTDHAGIATQAVVERRLLEEEKRSRHDLGREALVARIWAWKEQYEKRILGQLRDLGASCDWDRTRFTLDDTCAAAVREAFFRLFSQGLVRRGKRLVNWDTFLQTAVSDDEVFHEEVKGHFWHIRYDVIDPQAGEPASVTVATTRPETLLGDTAVAVHPDPAAALDAVERDLRAKRAAAAAKEQPAILAALEDLAARRRDLLPRLETLAAMATAGRQVRLPLLGRAIPLVADEWAKPELGSGCVKITPAHDPNDYEVGRRQSLPMTNILNPDGTLNAEAGPYAGLSMKKARQQVVADLEAAGQLELVEDRLIDLAHSDRSKTPIEPYLADQWFIRMAELAQPAIDAVADERIRIVPQRYAKGYLDWLSEKRDWPVSRQLWWGHRIPIWHVAGVAENDLAAAFAGQTGVAWRSDEAGGWFVCATAETLPAEAVAGQPLVRDPDVLDTWFSSALWPHSTLGWPAATPELAAFYPTSTLVTSRDILTLWVARMVIMGIFDTGEIPFREVSIHPKILDRYGETMSKSKGNGVDPVDVIEALGADALRFALAGMATETQDVRMPVDFQCPSCGHLVEQTASNRTKPRLDCPKCGKPFRTQWAATEADLALPRGPAVSEKFEAGRNFSNKLWNATRFVLISLDDSRAAPLPRLDLDSLELADRWLASRLASVAREASRAIDEYRYAELARILYGFAWDEFCSAYLELSAPPDHAVCDRGDLAAAAGRGRRSADALGRRDRAALRVDHDRPLARAARGLDRPADGNAVCDLPGGGRGRPRDPGPAERAPANAGAGGDRLFSRAGRVARADAGGDRVDGRGRTWWPGAGGDRSRRGGHGQRRRVRPVCRSRRPRGRGRRDRPAGEGKRQDRGLHQGQAGQARQPEVHRPGPGRSGGRRAGPVGRARGAACQGAGDARRLATSQGYRSRLTAPPGPLLAGRDLGYTEAAVGRSWADASDFPLHRSCRQ